MLIGGDARIETRSLKQEARQKTPFHASTTTNELKKDNTVNYF
jgi:hypothetical protein